MKSRHPLQYETPPAEPSASLQTRQFIILGSMIGTTLLASVAFFVLSNGKIGATLFCGALFAAGVQHVVSPGLMLRFWLFWWVPEPQFEDDRLWLLRLVGLFLGATAFLLAYAVRY